MKNIRYFLLLAVLITFCLFNTMGCSGDDDDDDDESIVITTSELTDGRVRMDYDVTLTATNTEGNCTWSITAGSLPSGLSLDSTGQISGQPAESGLFTFTVKVGDDRTTAEKELSLYVIPVLLMSGFGPFDSFEINASYEALLALDHEIVAGYDIRILELPVIWDESWDLLLDDIDYYSPDIIISTGVSGTDKMRYETTAKNKQWGTDNNGIQRNDDPIIAGAPETLSTGLPVQEMADAVEAAGYPTKISNNAGTFLCNFIFYNVMYYVTYEVPDTYIAGFIHVPPTPYYDSTFTYEDITAAHKVGISALVTWLNTGGTAAPAHVEISTEPVYSR